MGLMRILLGLRGHGIAGVATLSDFSSSADGVHAGESVARMQRKVGAARVSQVMIQALTPIRHEVPLDRARVFIMAYRLRFSPLPCGDGS
jgi:hypothetical protein